MLREHDIVKTLSGPWKFATDPEGEGEAKKWFAPTYPDQDWEDIRAGDFWEKQGHDGYDGASPGTEWEGFLFPGTGGYCTQADNWAWRLLKGKGGGILRHELSVGEHTLRLINRGGGMALDAILLVPLDAPPPAP